MTNIKALDKLKAALEACRHTEKVEPPFDTYWITVDACDAYIKELEAEIAERYIELPVDAEGVPWHMGDKVRRNQKDRPNIVTGIYLHADGTHKLRVSENAYTAWTPYASERHHDKPRTVEDVLAEFGRECIGASMEETNAMLAKYAAEIRELMGVSE